MQMQNIVCYFREMVDKSKWRYTSSKNNSDFFLPIGMNKILYESFKVETAQLLDMYTVPSREVVRPNRYQGSIAKGCSHNSKYL